MELSGILAVRQSGCLAGGRGWSRRLASCLLVETTTYLLSYAHRSRWSLGHQRPLAIAHCPGLLWAFRTSWSHAVSGSRRVSVLIDWVVSRATGLPSSCSVEGPYAPQSLDPRNDTENKRQRLQYVLLSGPGAIVCKSRATHRTLITCNMSCCVPRGTKGQLSY